MYFLHLQQPIIIKNYTSSVACGRQLPLKGKPYEEPSPSGEGGATQERRMRGVLRTNYSIYSAARFAASFSAFSASLFLVSGYQNIMSRAITP